MKPPMTSLLSCSLSFLLSLSPNCHISFSFSLYLFLSLKTATSWVTCDHGGGNELASTCQREWIRKCRIGGRQLLNYWIGGLREWGMRRSNGEMPSTATPTPVLGGQSIPLGLLVTMVPSVHHKVLGLSAHFFVQNRKTLPADPSQIESYFEIMISNC